MSSDPGIGAEEIKPELPVKQHKSHSSRCSSVEFDSDTPGGLQHQSRPSNDVFSDPTDCHAALCPIHHRYDLSRHQLRYFSDGTPPPVPRKRLVRTVSLPGSGAPPLSPLSPLHPLQEQPHNFDNPLYMMAPTPNTHVHEDTEEFKHLRGSPVALSSISQLSFDTPDEHLLYLFSRFDDQRLVFQGLQHRHLLFLRSMVQRVAAGVLLQGDAAQTDASSYAPQDFLLCEGSEAERIGDAVYYSLHSPRLPGRVLGLRVHKQPDGTASACTNQKPSHVNVQDVIAHFQPSSTFTAFMVETPDPSPSLKPGWPTAKPQGGVSIECLRDHRQINPTSIQSFLMDGLSLSIERDLPVATLEDFVQNSSSTQNRDSGIYDRQVCVLLLQILMGSQHLYISGSAAELRPRDIFLVWPKQWKERAGNTREEATDRLEEVYEKTEKATKVQLSWRTHGAPRVVLKPRSSDPTVPHPLVYIKSQIGDIIRYCLHSQASGPTLSKSSYHRGLLYLASQLHSEKELADMVAMLQVILWGPRPPRFDHRCLSTAAVNNWLTIKRALLVMKLAERGLIQDQSTLDWGDCMYLQYLSFTDPESVLSMATQLWLTLNAG